MIIGITGANGQLGQAFQMLSASYPEWDFRLTDRDQVDLTQPENTRDWLAEIRPDVLINCAAYTNVNRAEEERELARAINVEGVATLAQYCAGREIPLFHYSTDYVYHTERGIPYRETDLTAPKGQYAATKLEGEQRARELHPMTCVLRTSWVYGPVGHNFVRTMLRLGRERDTLDVVCDQIGTPTYTRDLAAASLQMIDRLAPGKADAATIGGVYNFSNEGVCSWYDFALAIFELSGIDCRVRPIKSDQFPSPVERPHYSVLDKSKIKTAFDLEIPHWREALKHCLSQI